MSRREPSALLLVLTVVLSSVVMCLAKEDPRRCGNQLGAMCCQSWGNTCIDPGMSCCDKDGLRQCLGRPFNASNPGAACGGLSRPNCAFSQMLERRDGFSSANAYILTILATGIYPDLWAMPEPEDEKVAASFRSWAGGHGVSRITFLRGVKKGLGGADTEGACMRDDVGNVLVTFRGTSSKADVATDADVFGSLLPSRSDLFGKRSVQLHDGFSDAYKSVRDDLLACVQQYVDELAAQTKDGNATAQEPRVWVTGHSLGAALAHLAAADLAQAGHRPHAYTIGSPRVGDRDWQRVHDEDYGLRNVSFRMVNNEDPVPRVPIRALGYRHVGTLVRVNHNEADCSFPEDQEADCPGLCVVNEHYSDHYLNATFACVQEDESIDLLRCPMEQYTHWVNYDLKAAEPGGPATLANESDAVLANATSGAAGLGRSSTAGGWPQLAWLAAASALALIAL